MKNSAHWIHRRYVHHIKFTLIIYAFFSRRCEKGGPEKGRYGGRGRCIIKNPISLKTSDVSKESLRRSIFKMMGKWERKNFFTLSDTHANACCRLSHSIIPSFAAICLKAGWREINKCFNGSSCFYSIVRRSHPKPNESHFNIFGRRISGEFHTNFGCCLLDMRILNLFVQHANKIMLKLQNSEKFCFLCFLYTDWDQKNC